MTKIIKIILAMCGGVIVFWIAFSILGSSLDAILPFGDKSGIFSAALVGTPLGASLGFVLSAGKTLGDSFKALFILSSIIIGVLVSFGFFIAVFLISEKYIIVTFLLQTLIVILVTYVIGTMLARISNNRLQRIVAKSGHSR